MSPRYVGLLLILLLCTSFHTWSTSSLSLTAQPAEINKQSNKVVIFIFSDGLKTQFTNAKRILDKFGFKATFDVVCNYVGKSDKYMNWSEIEMLHNEGHDIGSHSMNHVRLTELPIKSIEYEVAESKQCLINHGFYPSSFEYPFSIGSENKTIVDIVAKHYSFATRGNDALMFLSCDGFREHKQIDCRRYTENGTPTYANKYAIRNWSHDFEKGENGYKDAEALQKFIRIVNLELRHNQGGYIGAIPIIMYHGIGNMKDEKSSTDNKLFEEEMKYLYDNHFKVFRISDLAYNENNNYLYIKELKRAITEETTATSNITNPIEPTITNVTHLRLPPEPVPILQILKQLFGLK